MIYEPREDSYLLEKEVIKRAKGKSVLDMGAGSGIIGKAALRAGASSVMFADVNDSAVAILSKQGLNAVKSDLFSDVPHKFDIIAFNPPYLPADDREPADSALITSGGKEGDELTCEFLKSAKDYLNSGGQILLLLSSLTPMKRIESICRKQGLSMKRVASEKLSFEELFVFLLELNPFKRSK